MEQIKVTPNYQRRTFTIKYNGSKYKTPVMSKEKFWQNEGNSEAEWLEYMKQAQDIKNDN